jgi:hypothetical protein
LFISMCDGKEVPAGRYVRNCMVCPNIASYKCAGCPLRLCVTCKCFLVNGSEFSPIIWPRGVLC